MSPVPSTACSAYPALTTTSPVFNAKTGGFGSYSGNFSFKTQPDPPAKTEPPAIDSFATTGYRVKWVTPGDDSTHGGDTPHISTRSYRIVLKNKATGSVAVNTTCPHSSPLACSVTGLIAMTEYSVTVATINSAGEELP